MALLSAWDRHPLGRYKATQWNTDQHIIPLSPSSWVSLVKDPEQRETTMIRYDVQDQSWSRLFGFCANYTDSVHYSVSDDASDVIVGQGVVFWKQLLNDPDSESDGEMDIELLENYPSDRMDIVSMWRNGDMMYLFGSIGWSSGLITMSLIQINTTNCEIVSRKPVDHVLRDFVCNFDNGVVYIQREEKSIKEEATIRHLCYETGLITIIGLMDNVQNRNQNVVASQDGKLLIKFGVQPHGGVESPRITVFDMIRKQWSKCTMRCPFPYCMPESMYSYNAANLGSDSEKDELIVFGYIRREMVSLRLSLLPRYLMELTSRWFVRETLVLLAVDFCMCRLLGHWYISLDAVLQSRKNNIKTSSK